MCVRERERDREMRVFKVFSILSKRRKQPIASAAFNLACHTHLHTLGQIVMFIGERKILLREGQTVK